MKNNADLGRCFQPPPSASVGNTLRDLHNSSYPTQPHSIIANYVFSFAMELKKLLVSGTITASFSNKYVSNRRSSLLGNNSKALLWLKPTLST